MQRYFQREQKQQKQVVGVQIPRANCSYAGIAKVNIESQSVPARLNVPSRFDQSMILLDANSSGDDEAENMPGSNAASLGKSAPSLRKCTAGQFFDKRIILYKTEMCRAFTETGVCKYGFQCQFAHYLEELRPVLRHPRYKTDICKTWWKSGGKCPYGKRCCFIHDESAEELARLRGVNAAGGLCGQEDVIMKRVSFSLDNIHIPANNNSVATNNALTSTFAAEDPVVVDDSCLEEDETKEAWCHLPHELQELLL